MIDRTNPPSRRRLFFVALVLALLTASIVFAVARPSARMPLQTENSDGQQASAQNVPIPVRFEAELITLRPQGFEPAEITRPKGTVLLVVENRTGLDTVNLRLDREVGGRLREVALSRRRAIWRDLNDLIPGQYVLTEATHPNWTCRITITAQ
jgi:hypothetical protein